MILEGILLLAAAALSCHFLLYLWKKNFWLNLGIKQAEPVNFPLGNHPLFCWDRMTGKTTQEDMIVKQYESLGQPKVYGVYKTFFFRPELAICDLDILKDVMVKQFDHFMNRVAQTSAFGEGLHPTDQLWRHQLSLTQGQKWKKIRTKISPFFTPSKLKRMNPLIFSSCNHLVQELDRLVVEKSGRVDLMPTLGLCVVDGIAQCIFGMEVKDLRDPHLLKFKEYSENVTKISPIEGLKVTLSYVWFFKKLFHYFNIPVFKPKETQYYYDIFNDNIQSRKASGFRRGDMLDMFKDVIDEDSESGLDKSTVIGTAISMITAANTTSTSVLAYAFWELARHPDMQDRLREEIRNVLQISPEKASLSETFSLENLQKLDYLNMIIHETMRKHAPVPILTRGCTKDFLVEEADYKIKANEDIHIPCAAIMFDQRHFKTPHEFNPEHFSEEAKKKLHPMAFLGFGQGPRTCIGKPLALMSMKMTLAKVLLHFKFEVCDATIDHCKRDPGSLFSDPLEPLILQVVPIH